ncbi:actin cytoskeleton-regulatory complex protein PAN1 isoform X1 [Cajanus cajan]|uniref:actin cytoskeleton-regulatory complex protein PAN1 isoform X1 n=1 Tax=Cajanus cajan TaxID=3821 RepID=UPI0010FADFE9|nr:actin cytoskeleton-regulatory complex protein PAN1 isoform X1 [Cajanus cajan]
MEHLPANQTEAKRSPPPPPPPQVPHQSDVDEDDENVNQLDECSSLYRLMQDCVARSNRNWKVCQPAIEDFVHVKNERNKLKEKTLNIKKKEFEYQVKIKEKELKYEAKMKEKELEYQAIIKIKSLEFQILFKDTSSITITQLPDHDRLSSKIREKYRHV